MNKNGCGKQFSVGDFITNRLGIALCEKCNKEVNAPIMSTWTSGIVTDYTLKKFPKLKCGDRIWSNNN